MKYKRIGVMCGSSEACPEKYLNMAYKIGQELAIHQHEVIYGGGAKGLMRKVADGALDKNGIVHGYMPLFMKEVEWQHPALTNLHITADMAERKHLMMTESDAVNAFRVTKPKLGAQSTTIKSYSSFIEFSANESLCSLLSASTNSISEPIKSRLEGKRSRFGEVVEVMASLI